MKASWPSTTDVTKPPKAFWTSFENPNLKERPQARFFNHFGPKILKQEPQKLWQPFWQKRLLGLRIVWAKWGPRWAPSYFWTPRPWDPGLGPSHSQTPQNRHYQEHPKPWKTKVFTFKNLVFRYQKQGFWWFWVLLVPWGVHFFSTIQ